MKPRVESVEPMDDHLLRITFTNGEIGLFDCTPLLNFGVFQELRDEDYFRRVRAYQGTVVWPNEQDICPDTLYEDALKTSDPLSVVRPSSRD